MCTLAAITPRLEFPVFHPPLVAILVSGNVNLKSTPTFGEARIVSNTTTTLALASSLEHLVQSSKLSGCVKGEVSKSKQGKREPATSGGKVSAATSSEDPPMSPAVDRHMAYEYADEAVIADLSVLIDGKEVTALVYNGAHFSIMSQRLAYKLREVKPRWTGP